MPADRLRSLIDIVHSHNAYVSTGGYIERVISTTAGDQKTISRYMEACKEVGYVFSEGDSPCGITVTLNDQLRCT